MNIRRKLRTNSTARSLRERLNSFNEISNSPFESLVRHIHKFKITCLVDVGANVGQFGLDMRRHGYGGQIVSFEPVAETFNELSRTVKYDQLWSAFQIGLGSNESVKTINISGNDGLSSSLFEMKSTHITNFPESRTISTQKVKIFSLDAQLKTLGIDPQSILLKIDVQGYEAEVLKGASLSLSKIPLCYLEVSLQPLYEGEMALLPILNMLSVDGHEVIDIYRGIKSTNGDLLQLDILTKLSSI